MQRVFGTLADGRTVTAFALESEAGLRAEVLSYGGILRRLQVPHGRHWIDVVLGLPDLDAYLRDPAHLGTLVGRYGNRIAAGRCVLDGDEYRLSRNEGRHHLHGGHRGFGQRLWQVLEHARDHLVLSLRSPAGEEGYPGNVEVSVTLRLHGLTLTLEFNADSDASTPFNPTHHPYFNLAGDSRVAAASQQLRIPATGYLPVDAERIPIGTVAALDASAFDFRVPITLDARRIAGDPQLALGQGYDHCLVFADAQGCRAELYSPHSGVAMRLRSDAPALQLYEGQGLDTQHPGLGRGLCLEPQSYPDAPNRPAFPSALLRPGQRYRRRIDYRFAAVDPAQPWARAIEALGDD